MTLSSGNHAIQPLGEKNSQKNSINLLNLATLKGGQMYNPEQIVYHRAVSLVSDNDTLSVILTAVSSPDPHKSVSVIDLATWTRTIVLFILPGYLNHSIVWNKNIGAMILH